MLYIYTHIYIYMYSDVMKTIQCIILLITTMALWRHAGYGDINAYIYIYIYIYVQAYIYMYIYIYIYIYIYE